MRFFTGRTNDACTVGMCNVHNRRPVPNGLPSCPHDMLTSPPPLALPLLFCSQVPLRVSLRQLYEGDTFDTVYVRQAMCVSASQCEKNCKDCQGPGIAVRMHQLGPGFVQQVQVCRARGISLIALDAEDAKTFVRSDFFRSTNEDSYGGEINQKAGWSDSEVTVCFSPIFVAFWTGLGCVVMSGVARFEHKIPRPPITLVHLQPCCTFSSTS